MDFDAGFRFSELGPLEFLQTPRHGGRIDDFDLVTRINCSLTRQNESCEPLEYVSQQFGIDLLMLAAEL